MHLSTFVFYVLSTNACSSNNIAPQSPPKDTGRRFRLRWARNELFETVSKRGLGANIMFTMIAAIFGVLNLGCESIDLLLSAAGVHLLPFKSGHLSLRANEVTRRSD